MDTKEVILSHGNLEYGVHKVTVKSISGTSYLKRKHYIKRDDIIIREKVSTKLIDVYLDLVKQQKKNNTVLHITKEEIEPIPELTNNQRLKDVINFRLNAIITITLEDYKVVQDMLKLCNLYKLDKEYIESIKIKFKHFRL